MKEKEHVFHLDKQYNYLSISNNIIDVVGQGSYGVVIAAEDTEVEAGENNLVAIKKIVKAFE